MVEIISDPRLSSLSGQLRACLRRIAWLKSPSIACEQGNGGPARADTDENEDADIADASQRRSAQILNHQS